MKKIINSAAIIFFLIHSWSNVLIAQDNTDSLRIVNEALKMIQFPEPVFNEPFIPNPSPKEITDLGLEQAYTSETVQFKMRDGIFIHGNKFNRVSKTTVIFLHGALGSSYTNNKASGLIRESLQAKVVALDLRGHGLSEGVPSDVTTPNQYAEDLEDIISAIKKQQPEETIILAGHSMGGGIVLRHAETFRLSKVDGYVLFAPNFGTNAPTARQDFDLQNNFLKLHLSRGLGLYMLNQLGIHEYDSLKVVFYNLPEQMPIRSYTHRSIQAGVPIDYRKALKGINKPLLVLLGSADEAFEVEEYIPIIKFYSKGDIHIIENETHNGIRQSKKSMEKIQKWAITNGFR